MKPETRGNKMSSVNFTIVRLFDSEGAHCTWEELNKSEELKKLYDQEKIEEFEIELEVEYSAYYAEERTLGYSYEGSSPEEFDYEIDSAIDENEDDWAEDLTDEELKEIGGIIYEGCRKGK